MMKLKVKLNNGQSGAPYLSIIKETETTGEEALRVYFCKDGGIIQIDGRSVGCRNGARSKANQTSFEEAKAIDGIELGEI